MPVKKKVLICKPLDLFTKPWLDRVGVCLDSAEHFLCDGIGCVRTLLPGEGSTPRICPELPEEIAAGPNAFAIDSFLFTNGADGLVAYIVERKQARSEVTQLVPGIQIFI